MFSRNRDHNTRAEQPGRNMTGCSQRPRCCCLPGPRTVQDFSKEPPTCDAGRGINISGVDFWHAVEFSRNGRFLRSRFTGALRALPFVLAFPTLSDSFVSDSRSKRVTACFAFQFFAFAFPFPASPTLPDSFSFRFRSEFDSSGLRSGLCLSADSTLSEAFRPERIRLFARKREESFGSARTTSCARAS